MKILTHLSLRVLFIGILAGGLLAGCTSPAPTLPPAAPTIDPAVIVDAAVSTMSARLTEDALARPSATPQPTSTPLPPTATPVPATATPAFTDTPAASPTPSAAPLSAQVLYAVTYPDGKTQFKPNETFGLALGYLNNGSVAWEPGSTLKLSGFKGEGTVQKEIAVTKKINPGEKIEFDLWAFGSETPGMHTWYFQLYAANGVPVSGGLAAFTYEALPGD